MKIRMDNVWDRTAEFLSDNLALLLPIVIGLLLVPQTIEEVMRPVQAVAHPPLTYILSLVTLVVALVSLLGSVTITALALVPERERDSWKVALRRLPVVIGVSIILLLCLFVACLPIFLILAVGGVDLAALATNGVTGASPAALALAGLYMLFLLPVLLFVGARFGVLLVPIVLEERRGIGALMRAWRLSRGKTMAIIGVILLYLVVVLVAMLAARTVFGSIFSMAFGGGHVVSVANVLTALLVGAVAAIFRTIQAAFVAKLYLASRAAEQSVYEAQAVA